MSSREFILLTSNVDTEERNWTKVLETFVYTEPEMSMEEIWSVRLQLYKARQTHFFKQNLNQRSTLDVVNYHPKRTIILQSRP